MFWNKNFFRSSKFRLGAFFAVFLFVALTAVGFTVYKLLQMEFLKHMDNRLRELYYDIEYEYLSGQKPTPEWEYVRRVDKLPVGFKELAKKTVPDLKPSGFFQNIEDRHLYQVFGFIGNEFISLSARADGTGLDIRRMLLPRSGRHFTLRADKIFDTDEQADFYLLLGKDNAIIAEAAYNELPILRGHDYPAYVPGKIVYETIKGSRHRIRIAYKKLIHGETLVLGLSMHASDENLELVAVIFIWSSIAVFLLCLAIGFVAGNRMLKGVEQIGRTARKIAAGDYTLRVSEKQEGTELQQFAANFNFMLENTEKLMNELRTISDNIAHDLRTPLTRIMTCSEVTINGEQTIENYRDALLDNAEECRRMIALINMMLDISRTANGTSALHYENFDAADLLRQTLETMEMLSEQKQITLNGKEIAQTCPVSADKLKLRQVFANLVDNAVKFTPDGGSIAISLKYQSGKNVFIFRISDSGCGIAPEDQQKVFKRFFRTDYSRHLPGNGLGLSLVQAIVQAHGGTIELKSELNRGTTFTITFPVSPESRQN